jgi:hypothetical protein
MGATHGMAGAGLSKSVSLYSKFSLLFIQLFNDFPDQMGRRQCRILSTLPKVFTGPELSLYYI